MSRVSLYPFAAVVKDDTLKRYTDFVSRLFLMILRNTAKPIDDFPLHLTISQKDAVKPFFKALRATPKPKMENLIPLLHDLMMTLWEPYTKKKGSDFNCVVMRFLVVAHTSLDGQLSPTKTISPNLAAVQWCMRATFLKACHDFADGEEA